MQQEINITVRIFYNGGGLNYSVSEMGFNALPYLFKLPIDFKVQAMGELISAASLFKKRSFVNLIRESVWKEVYNLYLLDNSGRDFSSELHYTLKRSNNPDFDLLKLWALETQLH